MDPVAQFLIVVAAIFLIGAVGEMVFERTFIPDAIWLILLGVVLGPVLGFVTREQLNAVAPHFAALTLVVVLFEGGSRIKLGQLAKVAPRAGALALVTFLFAAGAIALIARGAGFIGLLPETWGWSHALLVGCILGGPSSIIIMPAMERAKLQPALANLVGLESAITDAFCVVGTAAMIDIMVAGDQAASPALALLQSFGLALAIGAVSGLAWLLFLRMLKGSEHAYPITLAVLLVLYVAIDAVGGSAALGILTVAIILGNAPAITKKFDLGEGFELGQSVRGVHQQIAFIIKSLFFTFMGLMLGPPWGLIGLGALLAVFIALARVPAGVIALLGSKLDDASRKMVLLSMPRGMAAGVLATLPAFAGVPDTAELPVFVFSCIVTTIILFAIGFPMIRKQLPTTAEAVVHVAGTQAAGDVIATTLASVDVNTTLPSEGVEPGLLQAAIAEEEALQATGAIAAGPTDSVPMDSVSTVSGPVDTAPADFGPANIGPAHAVPLDPVDPGPVDPVPVETGEPEAPSDE